MNKTIDFSKQHGLKLTQDTLAFMQSSYHDALGAIASMCGSLVFVTGCELINGHYNPGWAAINGELMPFAGGGAASNIAVETQTDNEAYGDGRAHPVLFAKRAVLVNAGGEPASRFLRLSTLENLQNTAYHYRGELLTDDTNAYSAEFYKAKFIDGTIKKTGLWAVHQPMIDLRLLRVTKVSGRWLLEEFSNGPYRWLSFIEWQGADMIREANWHSFSTVAYSGNYHDLQDKPADHEPLLSHLQNTAYHYRGELLTDDHNAYSSEFYKAKFIDGTIKKTGLWDAHWPRVDRRVLRVTQVYDRWLLEEFSNGSYRWLSFIEWQGTDMLREENWHCFSRAAYSGNYNDLSCRPALAAVATSGNYADLQGRPDSMEYRGEIINVGMSTENYKTLYENGTIRKTGYWTSHWPNVEFRILRVTYINGGGTLLEEYGGADSAYRWMYLPWSRSSYITESRWRKISAVATSGSYADLLNKPDNSGHGGGGHGGFCGDGRGNGRGGR